MKIGFTGTQAGMTWNQAQVVAGAEPKVPLIHLAKNKDTGEYHDEVISLDIPYLDKLEARNDEFTKTIKLGALSEREYSYTSVECKGCDHRIKCWFKEIIQESFEQWKLAFPT